MAMPAHSGAGGPVTMADFDSALVDFVTSRRKGPVGGLLGKACQTALPLPPRDAALTPPRPPRAREGPRLVLLARRLPPLLLPPPWQYGGATLLRACVRSGGVGEQLTTGGRRRTPARVSTMDSAAARQRNARAVREDIVRVRCERERARARAREMLLCAKTHTVLSGER